MLFFVECIQCKYHFVSECFDIDSIVDDMDRKFLRCCFPQPTVCIPYSLQSKVIRTGSALETTTCSCNSFSRKSSIIRSLFRFKQIQQYVVSLVVVCFPDASFFNFFTYVLVFILLFLSLLYHCFKVMICMYVCYMLFNKYSIRPLIRSKTAQKCGA